MLSAFDYKFNINHILHLILQYRSDSLCALSFIYFSEQVILYIYDLFTLEFKDNKLKTLLLNIKS